MYTLGVNFVLSSDVREVMKYRQVFVLKSRSELKLQPDTTRRKHKKTG
jgi:hypothetical protein